MKLRIFKLGSLEHKLLPTEEAFVKLSEMLKSDPTDLIWGPDLQVKELDIDPEDKQAIMSESDLTFNELRKANVHRCETVFHKLDEWSPSDWGNALAGECGEACNEIKKLRRLDTEDKSKDTEAEREKRRINIGKELADLICYADLTAARLGIDLAQAVRDKFNEVSDKRETDIKL